MQRDTHTMEQMGMGARYKSELIDAYLSTIIQLYIKSSCADGTHQILREPIFPRNVGVDKVLARRFECIANSGRDVSQFQLAEPRVSSC